MLRGAQVSEKAPIATPSDNLRILVVNIDRDGFMVKGSVSQMVYANTSLVTDPVFTSAAAQLSRFDREEDPGTKTLTDVLHHLLENVSYILINQRPPNAGLNDATPLEFNTCRVE